MKPNPAHWDPEGSPSGLALSSILEKGGVYGVEKVSDLPVITYSKMNA